MEISNEQLALVNERIAQLLGADSFYGKRLREHGIDHVATPEEFKKLPFSEKKDLRDAYPLGLMSVPEEKIVRMHSSSGTTGKPVIIPYTAQDVEDWATQFARCYAMAGVTNHDRVQITPGYGLWTAGIGFQAGCEKLGAMAVPMGPGNTEMPLIGSYQPRNAALAITALRVLRQQGWNIPESAIRTGLEQVSWPGRFELLRHSPAFVLDGSHNAHGMRATVQSLKDRFPGQKFVFLVSIMADKDVDEMLALLAPLAERFVTVTAHNPRAMPAQTLAEHIRAYGCTAEAADSIEAGVARAEELGGEGPVCALGTLYFSGDVRQAFAKINKA